MKKYNLLIVDDEFEMLESYKKLFKSNIIFNLTLCSSYFEAIEKLNSSKFDFMLIDYRLKEKNGIELIKDSLKIDPNLKIIMITGYGTIESSVEAMKAGATDFIEKPFNSKLLFDKLNRLIAADSDIMNSDEIKNFHGIIYKSKIMDDLINTIKKISGSDITVLLQGESGTGKELVARAIHNTSQRKSEAFVPVNCSALPENLFESELFGHEKGAFTGAFTARPGILEFANDGTFFLDEITETPINVQAKLLRLLEDKKIRRIGGNKEIDLDIRIISATNQNLEEAINNKVLRQDLYYRLSSFVINIPPLRERREDILPLFYHYMNLICKKHNHKSKSLSMNAENILVNYNWPGNVRELINLTNKLFFICSKREILEDDIPLPNPSKGNYLFRELREMKYPDAKEKILETFEQDYLRHNLSKYDGNISKTAEMCGIDRRTIHRIIKKHGLVVKQ